MRILILGGTTEASALAHLLARDSRFTAILSFAGRTAAPRLPPIAHRIGGFGGVAGLAAYLRSERIAALIDATHPFAQQMSGHAERAAAETGVALLAILRPAWVAVAGDRWTEVATMQAAAAALGAVPCRVLLTIGRQDLAPFVAAPWHRYVIRSVDAPPPDHLPPAALVIAARGPFDAADDRALLSQHAIDVVVTKNSGGTATKAKLVAARALGLPVIMIARPKPLPVAAVSDAEGAYAWLRDHAAVSLRGV